MGSAPAIVIYDLNAPTDDNHTPLRQLCTLRLPPAKVGETRATFLRSHASTTSPTGDSPPFVLDPSSTVIVIGLSVGPHPIGPIVTLILLVPSHTIHVILDDVRSSPQAPPRVVEWQNWGVQGSVLLNLPCSPSMQGWFCATTLDTTTVPFGPRHPLLFYDAPNKRSGAVVMVDVGRKRVGHTSVRGACLPQPDGGDGEEGQEVEYWSSLTSQIDSMSIIPEQVDSTRTSMPCVISHSRRIDFPGLAQSPKRVVAHHDGFTLVVSVTVYQRELPPY